jgi:hypothetical protein
LLTKGPPCPSKIARRLISLLDLSLLSKLSKKYSASSFVGYGAGLTGVTASMRPDDFDFNSDPFAGTIGYIQASGSAYKVATTTTGVELRYNDVTRGKFDITNGFSGSLYGIGDVLAFSGSVATRLF